eukprot:5539913-Amphidinium_carterae.1
MGWKVLRCVIECGKSLLSSVSTRLVCRLSWHAFLTPKLGWFSKPVCVALMLTPVLQAQSTVVVNPVSA